MYRIKELNMRPFLYNTTINKNSKRIILKLRNIPLKFSRSSLQLMVYTAKRAECQGPPSRREQRHQGSVCEVPSCPAPTIVSML